MRAFLSLCENVIYPHTKAQRQKDKSHCDSMNALRSSILVLPLGISTERFQMVEHPEVYRLMKREPTGGRFVSLNQLESSFRQCSVAVELPSPRRQKTSGARAGGGSSWLVTMCEEMVGFLTMSPDYDWSGPERLKEVPKV
jgi:hypothetical protein